MNTREYNKILNEYNRLKANLESIDEEISQKEKQWEKKEAYFKNLIDHTRDLCETILAKDRNEITLGNNYNWSSIETIELVDKAIESYNKYNKDRTDIMRKIIDTAEERAELIEALKEENIYLRNHQSIGSMSMDDIKNRAEEEIENEQKSNNCDNKTPTNNKDNNRDNRNRALVVDEDEDFDDCEIETVKSAMKLNESVSSHGNKFRYSDKHTKEKRKAESEIISHTQVMQDLLNKISETGMEIIRIIGEYGYSEKPIIQDTVMKNKEIKTSSSSIQIAITSLVQLNVIIAQQIYTPLRPKMSLLNLTSIGQKVFKVKFNKPPVISEMEKIMKEHDNFEHGYGIKDLSTVLAAKKVYTDISITNRPGIVIDNKYNVRYVPDVKAKYRNTEIYFEYERGTHTQKDFEAKIDKMLAVTKEINIVVPNMETIVKTIIPKLDKYVNNRNSYKLQNVVIRICTLKNFRDKDSDMRSNDDWDYYYDLNKGKTVIANHYSI